VRPSTARRLWFNCLSFALLTARRFTAGRCGTVAPFELEFKSDANGWHKLLYYQLFYVLKRDSFTSRYRVDMASPVTHATSDRIVDAALEALAEPGIERLTMASVARRAQVSVGTLYTHFSDKRELIVSAHEAFLARIDAEGDFGQVPADLEPAQFVRALVRRLVDILERNEPLLRAFTVQAVIDPTVSQRGSVQTRVLARRFKQHLLLKREHFVDPSPEITSDVCFRVVYDTASRRASHGAGFATERPLEWAQLATELATACAAYLLDSGLG
jgi:AcrR family transcriptional regulator